KYEIEWSTLSGYLSFLERRGVSQNVASFLGSATIREYVLGWENVRPTPEQMEQMRRVVEREMRDGALGVASALEYAPDYFNTTEDLIEFCKVAAKFRGKYITHMRSEGDRLLEAIDEVIRISRESGLPAEIYHFKAAGRANWSKMDAAIAKVEAARAAGVPLTADIYPYPAASPRPDPRLPPPAHAARPH